MIEFVSLKVFEVKMRVIQFIKTVFLVLNLETWPYRVSSKFLSTLVGGRIRVVQKDTIL